MELGPLVTKAFLAGAEGTEVFSGLGNLCIEEVEVYPARLLW